MRGKGSRALYSGLLGSLSASPLGKSKKPRRLDVLGTPLRSEVWLITRPGDALLT